MKKSLLLLLFIAAVAANAARAAPSLYVTQTSRPDKPEGQGSIQFLQDINYDGDYLDYGENILWAEPCDAPSMMEYAWGSIFVTDQGTADIFACRDQNGDKDALDYGETSLYAQLPEDMPHTRDIISGPYGQMFVACEESGNIYQLLDINDDGDALDSGETLLIAEGLSGPTGMAVYYPSLIHPNEEYNWTVLVTEQWSGQVRMLVDRNGDEDCLDYGESLVFADSLFTEINSPFGIESGEWGEVFVSESPAYPLDDPASGDGGLEMTIAEGRILKMFDLNGDGDCLDYGEVSVYAEGLNNPAGMEYVPGGGLYVAEHGNVPGEGRVTLLVDLNGDGDCLDYGEVMTVCDGMDYVTDIVIPEPGTLLMIGSALAALAGIAKKWRLFRSKL